MANSFVEYTGDNSTTQWTVTFPFISRDNVTMFDTSDDSSITFTWISDTIVEVTPAISSSVTFRIKRTTDRATRAVDYQNATNLNEATLDLDSNQLFYIAQELIDDGSLNVQMPTSAITTTLPAPEALKYLRWDTAATAIENAEYPQIIAQAGAPSDGDDGIDGDMYLNITNWDVYGPKASGAWGSSIGNIQGGTGATGDAGSDGSDGVFSGAEATVTPTTSDKVAILDNSDSDNPKYSTPANIADLRTLASEAEAQVGTESTKGMTALRTADAITAQVIDGYVPTVGAQGTQSSGTLTPEPTDGHIQTATNGGAHTIDPPTTVGSFLLYYTNNGSAGAVTLSGFDVELGDAIDTTDTNRFELLIAYDGTTSIIQITALQ